MVCSSAGRDDGACQRASSGGSAYYGGVEECAEPALTRQVISGRAIRGAISAPSGMFGYYRRGVMLIGANGPKPFTARLLSGHRKRLGAMMYDAQP